MQTKFLKQKTKIDISIKNRKAFAEFVYTSQHDLKLQFYRCQIIFINFKKQTKFKYKNDIHT